MFYKLSDYALKFNVTYRTAWNRFKAGKIPGAFFDETNHVCIPIKTLDISCKKVAIYSRVSGNDAKDNLERQEDRLKNFCITNGYTISHTIKEVASGMNDNRPKLIKLLQVNDWDVLVVEHKDRLTRFGFNYIETLLETKGKQILVVNNSSTDEKTDLVSDLVSIIYSFSARLYGQRSAKNKREKITKILEENI
jgi:predicted site-specific integrase-resolvase